MEKAVRDPEADRQIVRLQKQVAFLTGELNRLSSPVRDREKLEAELQRKRAELQMLNRSLSRKQHSLAVSRMAEKLFGPLEREQNAFFERLRQAEISPVTRLQLSRGVDLLRTYASRIEDALRTSSALRRRLTRWRAQAKGMARMSREVEVRECQTWSRWSF